jgi:hypothetical protein
MGLKNNFIKVYATMPADSNNHLPSGTIIGYIMVIFRFLFAMDKLPEHESEIPWDLFEFRFSCRDNMSPHFQFGPACLQRGIGVGGTKPTMTYMASTPIVQEMRQRILKVARECFESKNRLRATFYVLRWFYPDVNAIELFAWILQHSNLKCFKYNIPDEWKGRIIIPHVHCWNYLGNGTVFPEDFKLQYLLDFQHFSMQFPEEARLYLQELHQRCEIDTERRVKAIINYCLNHRKKLTLNINAALSAHYGELWRRVTST